MQLEPLVLLVILGAVNHQITHTLTVGVIFEEARQWVRDNLGAKLGYLTTCHLCAGTWIGLAEAAVAVHKFQFTGNGAADFLVLSFAVALIGRLVNELQALMSSTVAAIRAHTETRQASVTSQTIDTEVRPIQTIRPVRGASEDSMCQQTKTRQHVILWWIGLDMELAPNVGTWIEHEGQDFSVTRVVKSKTQKGRVDLECWPDTYEGLDPTTILVVGNGVQERVRQAMTAR